MFAENPSVDIQVIGRSCRARTSSMENTRSAFNIAEMSRCGQDHKLCLLAGILLISDSVTLSRFFVCRASSNSGTVASSSH